VNHSPNYEALLCSNVEQGAHASPTPPVPSQKAEITRCTFEVVADSGLGAWETTMRLATLALVHSTTEYCTHVWCRRAHTSVIDPFINNTLQTVTGCLRPTPVDNLLALQAFNLLSFVAKEKHSL